MIGPFNDHQTSSKRMKRSGKGLSILGLRYTGSEPKMLRRKNTKESDKFHAVILIVLVAVAFYLLISA